MQKLKVKSLLCLLSWHTTAIGLLVIGIGIGEWVYGSVDHIPPDPLQHLLVGIGLIFAKDAAK